MNWNTRSNYYEKSPAQKDTGLTGAMVRLACLEPHHLVLDAGCGTGVVTNAVAPLVREVIGIDTSYKMAMKNQWGGNRYFVHHDLMEPLFAPVFDRVMIRQVLHYLDHPGSALIRCYDTLKDGGKIVIAQAVPPHQSVEREYRQIMELRAGGHTFMVPELERMMRRAGFSQVTYEPYLLRQFSVKEWCLYSGMPEHVQNELFSLHVWASDNFKKCFNMKIINGDCLIDVKFAILTGDK